MNPYNYLNEEEKAHDYVVNSERKTYLSDLDIEYDFMDYVAEDIPKHLTDFAISILMTSEEVEYIAINDKEVYESVLFDSIEEHDREVMSDFVEDYPIYAKQLVSRIKSKFSDVSEVMIIRL